MNMEGYRAISYCHGFTRGSTVLQDSISDMTTMNFLVYF